MSVDTFASVSTGELIALAVGVGLSGLIAGTVAGLLGVGGGIVLVPVLYQTLSFLGVDEAVRMPTPSAPRSQPSSQPRSAQP